MAIAPAGGRTVDGLARTEAERNVRGDRERYAAGGRDGHRGQVARWGAQIDSQSTECGHQDLGADGRQAG